MEPQFGSGSALLGGTSALQEAMKSRGVDASVLNQVGGGAPTAQAMPMPPQGGQGMPMPQGPSQSPQAPQGAPQQAILGTPEAEIILKALSKRLEHQSDMENAQVGR